MEIRKFWKKAMLAAFASMWAGCDDGSANSVSTEDTSSSSSFSSSSSSAEMIVPSYGCGSCDCDGGCEFAPDYGVPYNPEEELLIDSSAVVVDTSFVDTVKLPETNEFDAPIAVYGPPCYFDGSCRED